VSQASHFACDSSWSLQWIRSPNREVRSSLDHLPINTRPASNRPGTDEIAIRIRGRVRRTRGVLLKAQISIWRVAEERILPDVSVHAQLIRDAPHPVPVRVSKEVATGEACASIRVAVDGLSGSAEGDDGAFEGYLGFLAAGYRPTTVVRAIAKERAIDE
jgi:hypothetical protein